MSRNKVLTAALVVLLFMPLGQRHLALRRQERALEETVAQGQEARRALTAVLAREAQMKARLSFPDLTQAASKLTEAAQVTLCAFAPGKPIRAGSLTVLPLTVELEGSYADLLQAISGLDGAGWALRGLHLAAQDGTIRGKVTFWIPNAGDAP